MFTLNIIIILNTTFLYVVSTCSGVRAIKMFLSCMQLQKKTVHTEQKRNQLSFDILFMAYDVLFAAYNSKMDPESLINTNKLK